jgi:hypothetical protein
MKHMVALRLGVPIGTQQLVFGLEYLDDDRVASSLPWSETNHTLKLLQRVRIPTLDGHSLEMDVDPSRIATRRKKERGSDQHEQEQKNCTLYVTALTNQSEQHAKIELSMHMSNILAHIFPRPEAWIAFADELKLYLQHVCYLLLGDSDIC